MKIEGWKSYAYPNHHQSFSHFYIDGQRLCGTREIPAERVYRPDIPFCEACDLMLMRIVELNNQFAADRLAIRKEISNAR